MTPDELKQLARDESTKRIIKEAIHEWLEEKFAEFGRWTFYGLIAAATAGATYLLFISWGWHK